MATLPSSSRVFRMYFPFSEGTVATSDNAGPETTSHILLRMLGNVKKRAFMTKDEKLCDVLVSASNAAASELPLPEIELKSYENPARPMLSRLDEE